MLRCDCASVAPDAGCDPSEVEEREARVLAEIAREGEAAVAFQGLRRRLGLHQQALTRTLQRLERRGLLARSDAGYRLTETGHCAVSCSPGPAAPARTTLGLVQALLPPSYSADALTTRLERRWFGELRWYGRSDGPGETVLTWLGPDGRAVRVRLLGATVALEAENEGADPQAAFAAARPLLAALAEVYAPRATPRPGARPADAPPGALTAGLAG